MAREGKRFRGRPHPDDPSRGDRPRGLMRVRGWVRALRLAAVLLGVLSSTGAAVASALGSAPASRPPRVVSAAARLPHGARAIGALSSSAQVAGAVALKLPDQPALQRFLVAVSNPRSGLYHHYLSRGQFAQRFAPSPAAVAAVEHQLTGAGLSVTHVSSNRLLVSFSGAAARVEAAFGTGLERVRLANGTMGRATTGSVTVPASVAPQVSAVLGLDQLVHDTTSILRRRTAGTHPTPAARQPRITGGGPSACAGAQSTVSAGGLTDQEVATAYGLDPLYSAGDMGSGQTVDIFEEEPYNPTDISAFDECYFGTDNSATNLTNTNVDGGAGTGPGVGEAALDVENVSALAPGAHIHVFTGPLTNLGGTDVWNAIAVADDAHQISTSWGLCETAVQEGAPGQQQVESEIFEQIAAQGQSVFSAAGDDGSDDCAGQAAAAVPANLSVDDPASQPYVTAVGGTTMVNATDPPTETVWNNGPSGGGGGGGISETWAMPSWQTASAVSQTATDQACSNDPSGTADNYHLAGYPTTLPAGTACRELPDVSAVADPQTGMTIYWDGSWGIIGGTSSAAPIWAAILAEINASTGPTGCGAANHDVGFVSPLLYEIGSSPDYADAFNDVTSGTNDNLDVGNGSDYPAGTGYDLATGLGTPRVTDPSGAPGLAAQLCADAAANTSASAPAVTGLTPSSGPSAGGTPVTITGSNFGPTTGHVYFGSVAANVLGWTPSAITVDAPAYTAPPGTSPGAPGRTLVTVVPSGSTSSSPNRNSIFDYTAAAKGGSPVVDYISTPYGPNAGGNTVDIVGANLTSDSTVMFGDQAASVDGLVGPSGNAQDELQVTVPATDQHCAYGSETADGICAVKVMVQNAGGTSNGPDPVPAYTGPIVFSQDGSFAAPAGCGCEVVPASDEYDYAPVPVVSAVSPSFMDEGGTSTATITGTGFNLLTYEWITIGDPTQEADQDFQLEGITPTTLTVGIIPDPNAPTIEPDPLPLTVLSAGQLSKSRTISYAGTPVLDSISKHIVPQSSPGSLTITGQGLSDVNMVLFQDQSGEIGPAMSTQITGQSDTQLTVAIPSYFAIPTDVTVCSVSGCSGTDPSIDGLTYAYPGRPTLTSSSPKSGPAAGGTKVTLNGTLDSNIIAVDFGGKAVAPDTEPSGSPSGQVTVTAPPGRPNTKVDITISTAGGELVGQPTSAVSSSATFTYGPPAPTGAFTLSAPKVSRSGTLTFHLKVEQAGHFAGTALTMIRQRGKRRLISFGKASRRVSRAGFATLVIKPSQVARRALAAGERLRVRVTVTFKPKSGSAVTHRRTVSVKRRT